MVESKPDSFAPNYKLQRNENFARRVDRVSECLFARYSLTHEQQREEEMKRYRDGFAWNGPMRFSLPIDFVRQYIPNERVLASIENALCNICDWPNARGQAFQLKQCIKYGAGAGLYEDVARIGDLVARIAKEKPYGEKTNGVDLVNIAWGDVYWNSNDDRYGTKPQLTLLIKRLSEFAEGKYEHCLDDYPMEPFWRLKIIDNLPNVSPEDKIDLTKETITDHYPTLVKHPDLAKNLGLPTG